MFRHSTFPIFLDCLERLRWLSAVANVAVESTEIRDRERLLVVVFPECVKEATRAIWLSWQLLVIPGLLVGMCLLMLVINLLDFHRGDVLIVWLVQLRSNGGSVLFTIKSLMNGYTIRAEICRSWLAYTNLYFLREARRATAGITTINH